MDRRSVGEENKGRRGGVLGDIGSGNPGRRPRVPASHVLAAKRETM